MNAATASSAAAQDPRIPFLIGKTLLVLRSCRSANDRRNARI
jgi:hypothetical protein